MAILYLYDHDSSLMIFFCEKCSALEPSSLHRAIYPVLTSYSTPDKQAYPRHSLSRAALITSGSPIFFLDAFTTLIVFYSSTADPSLPFPPPHDCKLSLSFITSMIFTVLKTPPWPHFAACCRLFVPRPLGRFIFYISHLGEA